MAVYHPLLRPLIAKKPPKGGFYNSHSNTIFGLTLPCFEARIGFTDHKQFAAAAHDFAITVPGLGRLKRRQDFHSNDLRILSDRNFTARYSTHIVAEFSNS